jgi:hypothetical protein
MAYSQIEPFGLPAADIHAALICSTLANVFRGADTKAFAITDFLLDWTGKNKPQPPSPEDMKLYMETMGAFGEGMERARREQEERGR